MRHCDTVWGEGDSVFSYGDVESIPRSGGFFFFASTERTAQKGWVDTKCFWEGAGDEEGRDVATGL